MLARILDASRIDMNDPEIQAELNLDLQRMDKLPHDRAPEGSNTYRVIVTPGITYMPGLHRFDFEIQYGVLDRDNLRPLGNSVKYTTERLPFL